MRATRLAYLLLAVSISLPVYVSELGKSAVQVCAILVVLAFVTEVTAKGKIQLAARFRKSGAFRLIILGAVAMAFAGLASAINAVDALAALEVAVRYGIGITLLIALVSSHQNDRALRRLASALVLGACGAAVIAIIGYQIPEIGAFSIGVSRRAKVFFEHPNQLGMVLSAIFVIPAARLMRNPLSVAGWIAAALIATGVVLSGSMTNVLLLFAGPFIVLLATLRGASLVQKVTFGIIGAVLLSALVLVSADAVTSLSPRLGGIVEAVTNRDSDLAEELPSVVERFGLYSDAWQLFADNPLLGIGGGNAYLYLRTPSGRPISHAHNYFLNVLMSMGIVGAIAVTLFALGWVVVALRSLRPPSEPVSGLQVGVGCALLVFMVSNQSSDSLGGTIIYLAWALLGMALALLNLERKAAKKMQSL